MSRYRIELRPAALRSLRKLDPQVRGRIQGAISLLADDPRPPNAKKLKRRDAFRVRVGGYRVIYSVEDDVLSVVVVSLGDRPDIYHR